MPGLTRDQMATIIESGRSVLYNGQILTDKSQLPSEYELAGNDPELKEKATENLRKQKALLDKQIAEAETKAVHDHAQKAEAATKAKEAHEAGQSHPAKPAEPAKK